MPEDKALGRGTYQAVQKADEVIVRAEGETPSAGYQVSLERSMLDVYPPEFVLYWTPPGGFAADVLTPFQVTASFSAEEPVRHLTVRDADGAHEVAVRSA